MSPENSSRWKELSLYFLRLGLTGFGGPLALIADMQSELVEKRKWITSEEFRQAFAAIKSMPGPVAFQVAQFLGTRYINRSAGILAGVLLLLPATVMMILLAHYYESLQRLQSSQSILSGFQVGALLLIAYAIQPLSRDYKTSVRFWVLTVTSVLCFAFHILAEPLLILTGGLFFLAIDKNILKKIKKNLFFDSGFSFLLLFWICFKAGAFVFGTGLAIIPLLERDFVDQLQWLSHQEFMDAIAFGQLTPGPISVTVTFVGYKLGGLWAAIMATFAIFLPSLIHQATWFPKFVGWISGQSWVSSFVEGATAIILGGIVYAVGTLFMSLLIWQKIFFLIILILSFKVKMPSWAWVLVPGFMAYLLGF